MRHNVDRQRKKVVVLHSDVPPDAGADEQDAIVQAAVVSSALAELGYEPTSLSFSLDIARIMDTLRELRPAFVFNLVETMAGQGNLIHIAPSVLDAIAIPYTGAGTEATFLTSNKVLTKRLLTGAGIATPTLFPPHEDRGGFATGVYIIKVVWEHASAWLHEDSFVDAREPRTLSEAISAQEKKLGMACFAEAYIEGREFNLSVLASTSGPEVLPPAEIRFNDFPEGKMRVVDYLSKWVADSFEYHHTPRFFDFPEEDKPLLREVSELARRCWKLFGLKGYARVDFRVDREGKPWVLEVNTNPCLSPDGGFYAALGRAGLTFTQAIFRIVKDATFS